jgi:hypothetical protein
MEQESTTTAAQERRIEQGDTAGRDSAAEPAAGTEDTRGSDSPADTEQPHQEQRWESEGGSPAE